MRVLIHREFTFEASHKIPTLPATHCCGRLHGHTYRAEIWCDGEIDDDPNGEPWHTDFGDIDAVAAEVKAEIDHRHLNDVPDDVVPFLGEDLASSSARAALGSASAERIAVFLHAYFAQRIPTVVGVRLWEGPGASVVVGRTR